MNDMTAAIVPRSDQWNYDDFMAGPITFKITGVKVKSGAEQPVEISLEGTEKFYRPCKSMARVLVAVWGPDSSQYIGRSLTLYGDPRVKWGGMEVGGIRISAMSGIESPITMALTVTRANKKPFTVTPLKVEAPIDWNAQINEAVSVAALGAVWKQIPAKDKPTYEAAKDARKAALMPPAQEPVI